MKVLLDECLPAQLRKSLIGHEAYTATYMGWSGIGNGRLLALAAKEGFAGFITVDLGIEYQQNPATLPLAVVVLHANSNDINDPRPQLLDALDSLIPKTVVHIGHER